MKPELYVARIDFEYNIGPYKENMVALFDSRDLTQEEANNEIKLYPQGYNKKIIFMSLQQFETVFRSLLQNREGK